MGIQLILWDNLQLQAPFRNIQLTPQMVLYHEAMSEVRVAVEWLFGSIGNYFKFIDFKSQLRVNLSALGKFYIVCALLQNAHTCLYGNIAVHKFGISPPSLQEYFRQDSPWTDSSLGFSHYEILMMDIV